VGWVSGALCVVGALCCVPLAAGDVLSGVLLDGVVELLGVVSCAITQDAVINSTARIVVLPFMITILRGG